MVRLLLVLVLGLLAACDRSDPPGARQAGEPEPQPIGATYGRDLLFLAGLEAEPMAALFRFSMVTEPNHVRRGARAWLGRNGAWSELLEPTSWRGEPMRDPWRLIPHGPLRIIADASGDLEALVHRGAEREFRLSPSTPVTEWSPTEHSHFRVRQADLVLDEDPLGGILLDVQVGSLTRGELLTTTAFLTDGRDLYLVVASGPDGRSPAWIRLGLREEGWENVGFLDDEEDEAVLHLSEPQGQLLGELRVTGRQLTISGADPANGGSDNGESVLLAANGWVEVHGERRPVYGIVRRDHE